MIKLKVLAMYGLLALAPAATQQATPRVESSPEAIVALEKQWLSALNAKDRQVLNDLMADDFMYISRAGSYRSSTTGALFGKSDLMPPDHPMQNFPKYELVDPAVHIYGDVAVLMARLMDREGEGNPTTDLTYSTVVFKLYGNHWRIIATHWALVRR